MWKKCILSHVQRSIIWKWHSRTNNTIFMIKKWLEEEIKDHNNLSLDCSWNSYSGSQWTERFSADINIARYLIKESICQVSLGTEESFNFQSQSSKEGGVQRQPRIQPPKSTPPPPPLSSILETEEPRLFTSKPKQKTTPAQSALQDKLIEACKQGYFFQ